MKPLIGETEKSVARSIALMEEAAGLGAQLVDLPEICNTGYVFDTRQKARALAERIPAGPTTAAGGNRLRFDELGSDSTAASAGVGYNITYASNLVP